MRITVDRSDTARLPILTKAHGAEMNRAAAQNSDPSIRAGCTALPIRCARRAARSQTFPSPDNARDGTDAGAVDSGQIT